jgi:cobalt/nickel transport system ATP-binding protein
LSTYTVDVKKLSYRYPDGTEALKDISIIISPGESVALVGANGAGKSTLLRHLNGTVIPESGTVEIGRVSVEKKNLKEIRKRVGMVFSNPDDQLFMPTVAEDVSFGPINLGWPPEEVRVNVAAALESLGAASLAGRHPFRLSAGEKRRAALAAVIVMEPDILVLDEPVSSLDPGSRRMLIDLLKGFTHTRLIATHDLDMAINLCERTIILNSGRIAADGPSSEILSDRTLLESNGLELPLSLQSCPVCGR